MAHCAVSIAYHRAWPSRAINEDPKKKKIIGFPDIVAASDMFAVHDVRDGAKRQKVSSQCDVAKYLIFYVLR